MKVKTSDLVRPELNYAVHVADGMENVLAPVEYSTRWEFGGPIIEREGITVARNEANRAGSARTMTRAAFDWVAECNGKREFGSTPLIAAMRCFVASKLGDEVEIPEELK
jgi:hypothetical protein